MSLLSVAARSVTDWMKLGFPEEVARRIVAGGVAATAATQSDDADASVASLASRGLKLVENRVPGVDGPDSNFKIVDEQGGKIGGAEFYVTPEGDLNAYAMQIKPEHRGDGIMNEAYDAVEEITGRKIEPSGALTDDGVKFWIRRDPDKMREYFGGTVTEERLDSMFAEALRGSADPRLLAGIAAGGGGVSAATAMLNQLAAAQAVKERGNIRAPNSGMLHGITMGARDLERRLEGHPAALLFPEGVVNYLEQLNREERPSRETALWALLDMI